MAMVTVSEIVGQAREDEADRRAEYVDQVVEDALVQHNTECPHDFDDHMGNADEPRASGPIGGITVGWCCPGCGKYIEYREQDCGDDDPDQID